MTSLTADSISIYQRGDTMFSRWSLFKTDATPSGGEIGWFIDGHLIISIQTIGDIWLHHDIGLICNTLAISKITGNSLIFIYKSDTYPFG